jgi:hypothetical protein
MIRFYSYIPKRKNGKLKKPRLRYSSLYISSNERPHRDIGKLHEIHIGWLVIHITFYW